VLLHQAVTLAYQLAADDIFWISGWLSLALIAVVWFARRSIPGGAGPVAAD